MMPAAQVSCEDPTRQPHSAQSGTWGSVSTPRTLALVCVPLHRYHTITVDGPVGRPSTCSNTFDPQTGQSYEKCASRLSPF